MRLRRFFASLGMAMMGVLGLSLAGRNLSGQTLANSQDLTTSAWQLEARGDGAEARVQLQRAVETRPNDPLALQAYAEFLDRHRDPAVREAYDKLRQMLGRNGASTGERTKVARRLAELDLIAGDRAGAEKHLEEYRALGGNGLTLPPESPTSNSPRR